MRKWILEKGSCCHVCRQWRGRRGVTQTGQEVTAIVADNFVKETTTACVMCHQCGVDVKPVDVGMVRDTTARTDLKVMYGTRNMTKGPAMTRDESHKGN